MKANKLFTVSLLLMIIEIIIYFFLYNRLEDTIPVHYNMHNEPTDYGSKKSIFFLLSLNVAIYIVLAIVSQKFKQQSVGKILNVVMLFIPVQGIIEILSLYFSTKRNNSFNSVAEILYVIFAVAIIIAFIRFRKKSKSL